jgi:hypothetical protein
MLQAEKDKAANANSHLAEANTLPANSKALLGQPIYAKLDEMLQDHDIDRSAMFGGAINGNGCRHFMQQAKSPPKGLH